MKVEKLRAVERRVKEVGEDDGGRKPRRQPSGGHPVQRDGRGPEQKGLQHEQGRGRRMKRIERQQCEEREFGVVAQLAPISLANQHRAAERVTVKGVVELVVELREIPVERVELGVAAQGQEPHEHRVADGRGRHDHGRATPSHGRGDPYQERPQRPSDRKSSSASRHGRVGAEVQTPQRLDADHERPKQYGDNQGVGPPVEPEEPGHQPGQRQRSQKARGPVEAVKGCSRSKDQERGAQQTDGRAHGEVPQERLPLAHGRPVLGGEPRQQPVADLSERQAHGGPNDSEARRRPGQRAEFSISDLCAHRPGCPSLAAKRRLVLPGRKRSEWGFSASENPPCVCRHARQRGTPVSGA